MTWPNVPTADTELHDRIVIASAAVTGVAAARLRDDPKGGALLLEDYHQQMRARGVSEARAWQLLFTASMQWGLAMLPDSAEANSLSQEDLLQKMALGVARRMAGLT